MGPREAANPASSSSSQVAPGVRLALSLPEGATPEPEASLPAFELGPISGAKVTLRAGFAGDFGLLRAACATAPARGYAPGIEDIVLGRATQIARGALPNVTRLEAGPARSTASGFDQRLEGEATLRGVSPGDTVGFAPIAGRHLFAFTEGGSSAVICTVACVERAVGTCTRAIDSTRLEGSTSPPPPPSPAVALLFASVEHPLASLALLAVVGVAIVSALLARRPRSRQPD